MRLPGGFDSAFIIPTTEEDQYGNPIALRLPASSEARQAGDGSRRDPVTGRPYEIWLRAPRIEFVLVPAGEFMMGRATKRRVRISKAFYLAKYELTQLQWARIMGRAHWSGKRYVRENGRHPAVFISWEACQAFVDKLNSLGGSSGFRLPTEAEWEYACRAGSDSSYCFGDDIRLLKDYAWYRDNAWSLGEKYAHPVGLKRPNAWGLYDMHGNVWEWCQDRFGEYPSATDTDPTGPGQGLRRLFRGGGFFHGVMCASVFRDGQPPALRHFAVGVRPLIGSLR